MLERAGTTYSGQALESASIVVPSDNTLARNFDFCLEGLTQTDDPGGTGSGGSGSGGTASGGASSGGASSGGASSGGAASGGASSGGAGSGGAGTGGSPPTYDGGYLTSGTWNGYAWTDAVGAGSSITPDDFSSDEDGLPYCVSGIVAPESAFGNVAQLAWNVNQAKGLDPPIGSLIPAEEGVDVNVTNNGGSELRVQIVGVDPTPGNGVDDANRYCAPLDANGHIAWTEFNTKCWDYTGDAFDTGSGPVEAIVSISILVPGNNVDPVTFDFCLNQLDPADSNGGGGGGTGFGFYPTTVDSVDAEAAYAAWKTNYLVDCGSGVYRVASNVASETVSEGIGYGMLIAVSDFTSGQDTNNRAILDGLWAFYNQNRASGVGGDPSTGLMNWKVQGCHGATVGANSATDAELDVAMALVLAEKRWPGNGYGALATAHIAKIKQHETTVDSGYALLKPGDQFGGADCLNASYFAPGYYRSFADHTGDAFWDTLADDTYVILANHDNNTTGLVPNWADINGNTSGGGPSGCNWYSNANKYYYDAARTPWRIGVDYNWYGTAAADAYLDRVSAWVDGKGVGNLVDGYHLNGADFGSWNSPVFVGAFGVGSMAYSQSLSNSLGTSLKNLSPTSYFSSSLRVIYLQMLSGDFNRP